MLSSDDNIDKIEDGWVGGSREADGLLDQLKVELYGLPGVLLVSSE
jgi:hypothetical protein